MQSGHIEILSYIILGTIFLVLEVYQPRTKPRRQIVLDLLGGGIGLLAVVLSCDNLKDLFDRWGAKDVVFVLNAAQLPTALKVLIMLLCIDFCLYWIYRAMHVPVLWRTHMLHHSVELMTWLAGMRTSAVHAFFFTFPQVLIPFYVFSATQIEAGLAISGVIFAQIFIHSNVDAGLGFVGRWILVTPNTHLIHHGCGTQRDCNFGSVFILWDRLFGTWLAPEKVDDSYQLGLGPRSTWEARRLRTLLGL